MSLFAFLPHSVNRSRHWRYTPDSDVTKVASQPPHMAKCVPWRSKSPTEVAVALHSHRCTLPMLLLSPHQHGLGQHPPRFSQPPSSPILGCSPSVALAGTKLRDFQMMPLCHQLQSSLSTETARHTNLPM